MVIYGFSSLMHGSGQTAKKNKVQGKPLQQFLFFFKLLSTRIQSEHRMLTLITKLEMVL